VESLIEKIRQAESSGVAVGHFNISDLSALRGIFESAQKLNSPVIIGLSDGERKFVGAKQAVALVGSLREQYGFPIFLNADHVKTLDLAKEAAEAGFDAVMFDAGDSPLDENIRKTKEAVEAVKSINREILVEGEIGYIAGHSSLINPGELEIKEENLVKPEEAERFIKETGVDLLAPAVGNVHGMFKDSPLPNLDIERIRRIKESVGVPLVLHGGSGLRDEDFKSAISAGISVIHINTELRLAWRKAIEGSLKDNPEEIAPYKVLPPAVEAIGKVVEERLKLFNKLI
jgi:fructose-bisphosphate aldolase class II